MEDLEPGANDGQDAKKEPLPKPGDHFPSFKSKYLFTKSTGLHNSFDDDLFTTFTWCEKCSSVFESSECVSHDCANPCPTQLYPDHSQMSMRASCGNALGKLQQKKNAKKGEMEFIPNIPYPFASIRQRFAELYQRPSFPEQIEAWRHRARVLDNPHSDRKTDRIWRDVYDGDVWKRFQSYNGEPTGE